MEAVALEVVDAVEEVDSAASEDDAPDAAVAPLTAKSLAAADEELSAAVDGGSSAASSGCLLLPMAVVELRGDSARGEVEPLEGLMPGMTCAPPGGVLAEADCCCGCCCED